MSYEPEARQKQNSDTLYFQGAMCAKKNACFFTFYKRFFKLFTLVLTPQTKFGFSAPFLIRFLRYFSFCICFSVANFIKICAKNSKKAFFHLLSLVFCFPYFTICILTIVFCQSDDPAPFYITRHYFKEAKKL